MISSVNNLGLDQTILLVITLFLLGFALMAGFEKIRRVGLPLGLPIKLKLFTNRRNIEAEILNALPFPIRHTREDGTHTFENTFALTHSFDPQDRFSLELNGQEKWFSTTSTTGLSFGIPIDSLIKTEGTLKRFMATLSTTFAHLTVGIAVFNDDNTLHLFNPALTNLLNLDPTWLAMRPGMASFFDNLRENRHIPDRKNYIEWRRNFLCISGSESPQGRTEQWLLPDGRTLQVTAQPHSQGAVAFLFEDISAQIAVERQHRTETALNQAVLDKVSDAVVVLDSAGAITFANTNFDQVFDVVSTESFAIPSIKILTNSLKDTPTSKQFWDTLRATISRSVNKPTWKGGLQTKNGMRVPTSISSGPNGSTLIVFKTNSAVEPTLIAPIKQVG